MNENKYEKFKEMTTKHIELEINSVIESNISNVVVQNYIFENKNVIKRYAATKTYKNRQSDTVELIQLMLKRTDIQDVDEDLIVNALRKIGIYSNDRKNMCIYTISCVLIYAISLLIAHLIKFALNTEDYLDFVFLSITISLLLTMIISVFLADTKFRLFRVK